MSVDKMVAIANDGSNKIFRWEKEFTITSNASSNWCEVPDDAQGLTYSLSFDDGAGGVAGGGTAEGKVEVSGDLLAQVKVDDTNVVRPVDWAKGTITNQVTTQDFSVPFTAFRVTKTGGTGRVVLRVIAR